MGSGMPSKRSSGRPDDGPAPFRCTRPGSIPTEPETDDASSLRLYAAVVDRANVFGKDVLEVGCGRGAGSHFILSALQARSVTGVDLAGRAIARCRAEYRQTGLTFRQADAERLPFANASFDVVVNIESSHAYPSMAKFLDQVGRVLRPGGFLLFADLRAAPKLAALRSELRASDLGVVEEEDITANVVRSLERRSPSTLERLQAVPGPFRAAAIEFSAVVGTPMYELLKSGQTRYIRLILRKTSSFSIARGDDPDPAAAATTAAQPVGASQTAGSRS